MPLTLLQACQVGRQAAHAARGCAWQADVAVVVVAQLKSMCGNVLAHKQVIYITLIKRHISAL